MTLRVGVTAMLTDRTLSPASLAREAEELGFGSLFLPEHTHMPVERTTEHPIADRLPDPYRRTLDPFVALGMAAEATEHLLLGTGILLLAQRDPIATAKAVATLDHLSGGRAVLGVGYGWNREELEHHGVAWRDRREAVHDRLAAMRSLWTEEVAAHDGPHARFGPSWSWPKPAGRVPVWLGVSAGPRNLAAVARHADGWIPHGSSGLAEGLVALQRACDEVGRDPDEVAVVPFGIRPTPAKLDRLVALGMEHVVLLLEAPDPDGMRRELDEHAALLDAWSGGDWRLASSVPQAPPAPAGARGEGQPA